MPDTPPTISAYLRAVYSVLGLLESLARSKALPPGSPVWLPLPWEIWVKVFPPFVERKMPSVANPEDGRLTEITRVLPRGATPVDVQPRQPPPRRRSGSRWCRRRWCAAGRCGPRPGARSC